MTIYLLAALFGSLVGLALGLVGAGGSILTVPALIYGLGLGVREAVPASLALVGSIAATGAVTHYRQGTVRLGVALRFGAAGVIGALIGARLNQLVPPRTLLSLFALVMMAAAVSLARRDAGRSGAGAGTEGLGQHDPRFDHHPHWIKLTLVGFGVGLMTGFFGVGGGFVIVPSLALLLGLPTRQAVGTSLVVIVINCLAGLVGHLARGQHFDVAPLLVFAGAGFAATTVGAQLAGRWPAARLSKVFAVVVAGVGVYLLVRNGVGK